MMQMPLSLNHLLERAGTLFASNEIISRLPDKSLRKHSYGAFYQRTRQLAQALQNLGLHKGERVATLCWNHHAHLECYFGIPAAGGVMHTLNLRLSPEEIAWIAGDAQDKVLIIDDVLLPLYQQFAHLYKFERVIVFPFSGAAVPAPFTDYEQLLASTDTLDFQYAPHAEDDAVSMCYTSGTTGRPKGVVYSHRSTILHTLVGCLGDFWGLKGSDVIFMRHGKGQFIQALQQAAFREGVNLKAMHRAIGRGDGLPRQVNRDLHSGCCDTRRHQRADRLSQQNDGQNAVLHRIDREDIAEGWRNHRPRAPAMQRPNRVFAR
jgi:acyl-CoA synthetase (AMP-forming)/AMP-acid ligase II